MEEPSTSAPVGQARLADLHSLPIHARWHALLASNLTAPMLLAQVVCPGDNVLLLPKSGVVRIGGGVQQAGDSLVAIKAGRLRSTKNGKLWIDGRQKR